MGDLICRKSMRRCLTPGMCSPHGGCQTSILKDCDVRYAGDSGSTAVNPFGPLAGTISAEDYRRCMAERDQLKAELERVRADAERYQWARRPENGNALFTMVSIGECGPNMDAAVDAAMGKGGGQNGSKTAETRASAGLEGGGRHDNSGGAENAIKTAETTEIDGSEGGAE